MDAQYKLKTGDTLHIEAEKNRYISTCVEQIRKDTILAADFLMEIWNTDWRENNNWIILNAYCGRRIGG